MTTYDGNELRDALRARLAQRWDEAADNAEMSAISHMRAAMNVTMLDSEQIELVISASVAIPRSTDPAVAVLIESRATAIASQVAAILP